jgi:hypothetical protein
METTETATGSRRMRWIMRNAIGTLALGLALSVAGCDGIFDVENPGSLLDEDLASPGLLDALGNTAEGNITGTYSSLNTRSGLLNGEIFHPSTQLENIDAMRGNRLASNSSVEDHWRGLAQARWLADEMIERISVLVPNPGADMRVAKAHFFGGVARVAMADHYNVIVYGPEDGLRGPIDVLEDALTKFQAAATIAGAAGDANYEAAALGQIARVYRALYFEELHLRGNEDPSLFAQAETAALDALAADPDYEVALRFGAPGGSNAMAQLGGPFGGVNRMDESYLFVEDPVTGEWDPRLPHEEDAVYAEALGNTSFNLKFAAREAPLPISRSAEAMLIIAEARLLDGDPDGAVDWINEVRAAARVRTSASDWAPASRGWPPVRPISDLPDFASTDEAEIQDQIIHERRAEFWMEMRRWQDMRYYEIMPYRWFDQNQAAGVHLRWPPSPEEISNNPNLTPDIARRVYVN